jgi:hypothetical protein
MKPCGHGGSPSLRSLLLLSPINARYQGKDKRIEMELFWTWWHVTGEAAICSTSGARLTHVEKKVECPQKPHLPVLLEGNHAVQQARDQCPCGLVHPVSRCGLQCVAYCGRGLVHVLHSQTEGDLLCVVFYCT